MSMTVTMSETGLLELPEAVRRHFRLTGTARLLLEVSEDVITLRPQLTSEAEVPVVKIEKRGDHRVIVGPGPLSDEQIIRAIDAGRSDREERLLAFRKE